MVPVKEFNLSYHHEESTILYAVDPNYGNL